MSKSAERLGEEFSIQSLGAAGGIVTGSLHKLKHKESTIPIFFSPLFQGGWPKARGFRL